MLRICLATFILLAALPANASPGPHTTVESTPTTLYMHVDGMQDFPINTQPPDDRYKTSEAVGLGTHSTSCTPDVGVAVPAGQTFHTWYGYSSPGYVEYDFEQDGGPRYHKERGLSFEVDLDTKAPASVYWYLESQALSGETRPAGVDPNQAPLPVPNVAIRATLRTGDDVSVGDAAFNAGQIIAQGQTEPVLMSPHTVDSADHVTYAEVDGRHVYGFRVDLSYEASRIPADESFNLRMDVFMEDPTGTCAGPGAGSGGADAYVMPNTVRVHTSPEHRPRMELSVLNPLRIDYLHPQFVGEELVIHAGINSPWGSYDVDEAGGLDLTIVGPSEATSLEQVALVTPGIYHHNQHQEAVEAVWAWPYLADNAAGGIYTIKLTAWNDQRTAYAEAMAQFEMGKTRKVCTSGAEPECQVLPAMGSGDQAVPGVSLAWLLALVGAAGAGRRAWR